MKPAKALRHLLLSLSLAAGVFAAPAYAQINFNVSLAPPAPQHEAVPNIAPGYVWAPGYWGGAGERHVWVSGRSIMQREGHRWVPDRWDQRSNSYYRTAGHWVQDTSYKPVKMKKEKKPKGWKHDNLSNRGNGKQGKGNKRGD